MRYPQSALTVLAAIVFFFILTITLTFIFGFVIGLTYCTFFTCEPFAGFGFAAIGLGISVIISPIISGVIAYNIGKLKDKRKQKN